MTTRRSKRKRRITLISASVLVLALTAGFLTLKASTDEDSSPVPQRVCKGLISGNKVSPLLPKGNIEEDSYGFPKASASYCELNSEGTLVTVSISRGGPFPRRHEVLKNEPGAVRFGDDYGIYRGELGSLRLFVPCDALPRSRNTMIVLVTSNKIGGQNPRPSNKRVREFLDFGGHSSRVLAKYMNCSGWQSVSKQPPTLARS